MKNYLNKIERKIRGFFLTKEEKFYENFFVHNPEWNNCNPNADEMDRWNTIRQLIPDSNKTIRILEVGCGRGWMTNLLSQYGNAEGIDPVKGVIRHAKRLYPKISFQSGYIDKLTKAGKKFNLIVASEVIEHIPHNLKNNFISDLNTLLLTDGFLIITTPRKEALNEREEHSNQPIEDWLTEAELEEVIIRNNFEVLNHIRITPSYINPPVELYQAWLVKKIS